MQQRREVERDADTGADTGGVVNGNEPDAKPLEAVLGTEEESSAQLTVNSGRFLLSVRGDGRDRTLLR